MPHDPWLDESLLGFQQKSFKKNPMVVVIAIEPEMPLTIHLQLFSCFYQLHVLLFSPGFPVTLVGF